MSTEISQRDFVVNGKTDLKGCAAVVIGYGGEAENCVKFDQTVDMTLGSEYQVLTVYDESGVPVTENIEIDSETILCVSSALVEDHVTAVFDLANHKSQYAAIRLSAVSLGADEAFSLIVTEHDTNGPTNRAILFNIGPKTGFGSGDTILRLKRVGGNWFPCTNDNKLMKIEAQVYLNDVVTTTASPDISTFHHISANGISNERSSSVAALLGCPVIKDFGATGAADLLAYTINTTGTAPVLSDTKMNDSSVKVKYGMGVDDTTTIATFVSKANTLIGILNQFAGGSLKTLAVDQTAKEFFTRLGAALEVLAETGVVTPTTYGSLDYGMSTGAKLSAGLVIDVGGAGTSDSLTKATLDEENSAIVVTGDSTIAKKYPVVKCRTRDSAAVNPNEHFCVIPRIKNGKYEIGTRTHSNRPGTDATGTDGLKHWEFVIEDTASATNKITQIIIDLRHYASDADAALINECVLGSVTFPVVPKVRNYVIGIKVSTGVESYVKFYNHQGLPLGSNVGASTYPGLHIPSGAVNCLDTMQPEIKDDDADASTELKYTVTSLGNHIVKLQYAPFVCKSTDTNCKLSIEDAGTTSVLAQKATALGDDVGVYPEPIYAAKLGSKWYRIKLDTTGVFDVVESDADTVIRFYDDWNSPARIDINALTDEVRIGHGTERHAQTLVPRMVYPVFVLGGVGADTETKRLTNVKTSRLNTAHIITSSDDIVAASIHFRLVFKKLLYEVNSGTASTGDALLKPVTGAKTTTDEAKYKSQRMMLLDVSKIPSNSTYLKAVDAFGNQRSAATLGDEVYVVAFNDSTEDVTIVYSADGDDTEVPSGEVKIVRHVYEYHASSETGNVYNGQEEDFTFVDRVDSTPGEAKYRQHGAVIFDPYAPIMNFSQVSSSYTVPVDQKVRVFGSGENALNKVTVEVPTDDTFVLPVLVVTSKALDIHDGEAGSKLTIPAGHLRAGQLNYIVIRVKDGVWTLEGIATAELAAYLDARGLNKPYPQYVRLGVELGSKEIGFRHTLDEPAAAEGFVYLRHVEGGFYLPLKIAGSVETLAFPQNADAVCESSHFVFSAALLISKPEPLYFTVAKSDSTLTATLKYMHPDGPKPVTYLGVDGLHYSTTGSKCDFDRSAFFLKTSELTLVSAPMAWRAFELAKKLRDRGCTVFCCIPAIPEGSEQESGIEFYLPTAIGIQKALVDGRTARGCETQLVYHAGNVVAGIERSCPMIETLPLFEVCSAAISGSLGALALTGPDAVFEPFGSEATDDDLFSTAGKTIVDIGNTQARVKVSLRRNNGVRPTYVPLGKYFQSVGLDGLKKASANGRVKFEKILFDAKLYNNHQYNVPESIYVDKSMIVADSDDSSSPLIRDRIFPYADVTSKVYSGPFQTVSPTNLTVAFDLKTDASYPMSGIIADMSSRYSHRYLKNTNNGDFGQVLFNSLPGMIEGTKNDWSMFMMVGSESQNFEVLNGVLNSESLSSLNTYLKNTVASGNHVRAFSHSLIDINSSYIGGTLVKATEYTAEITVNNGFASDFVNYNTRSVHVDAQPQQRAAATATMNFGMLQQPKRHRRR